MSKLRLVGKIQRRLFLEKAEKWWSEENAMKGLVVDVNSIAIRAVAEYMANQKGLTLYNKK